ncbi:hypothetical protein SLE2022_296690 [Rubroshorea leprosula]
MAFPCTTLPRTSISSLLAMLLLVASLLPAAFAQDPPTPGPFIADCSTHLLALMPCGPFVQGTAKKPVESCCNSLNQLFSLQPGCLCLLLNNTTLSTIPLNRTLAMQLPALCKLQANISSCSGESLPPSSSSGSQVSLGTTNNSTIASTAVPSSFVPPATSPTNVLGSGAHRNTVAKQKATGHLTTVAVVAILLRKLFY